MFREAFLVIAWLLMIWGRTIFTHPWQFNWILGVIAANAAAAAIGWYAKEIYLLRRTTRLRSSFPHDHGHDDAPSL